MRKLTKLVAILMVLMITSALAFAQQANLSTSNVADPLPQKESIEFQKGQEPIEAGVQNPDFSFYRSTIFTESFDDITFPPAGWTRTQLGAGTINWARTATTYSGAGAAWHTYQSADLHNWLITPAIALDELQLGEEYILKFYERNQWMGDYVYSGVWISTGSNEAGHIDFVEIYEANVSRPSYAEVQINLTSYAGSTIYLAFVYEGNFAHNWWIDEISVGGPPPPPPPPPPGDVIETAFVIPALPYSTSGTTVGFNNNYDEVCPFSGSIAPDVVYAFTPAVDMCIDIDLCGSAYDTKLYVYENAHTPGLPFACNDDYYGSGDPCGSWVSALFGLELTGGNTYYIVIDGYGSSAGAYELSVTECPPPYIVECPPDGIPEIEPCGDDLNGGCNMAVPAFQSVNHGDIICGTLWAVGGTRDTDWYELVLTHPRHVILHADAEEAMLFGLLNADPDNPSCPVTGFVANGVAAPYASASLDLGVLDKGTYWIFAGLTVFNGFPCDVNYTLEFEVLIPPPVPVSNWALYFGILLMVTFVVIRFRRMI